MMKKTLLLMMVSLCLLSPICASAYTAYVSVDSSLDLSTIQGFEFTILISDPSGLTLTTFTDDSTVAVNGVNKNGAVPLGSYWNIQPVPGPPPGVLGQDFGDFIGTGTVPLKEGVILSLVDPTDFTLDIGSFSLRSDPLVPDSYLPEFTVTSNFFGGGAEYIYTAVPIPGSILLLGSGVLCLVGLARRKRG